MARTIRRLVIGLTLIGLATAGRAAPPLRHFSMTIGGKSLQFVEDPDLVFVYRSLSEPLSGTGAAHRVSSLAHEAVAIQSRLAAVNEGAVTNAMGKLGPVLAINASAGNRFVGAVVHRFKDIRIGRISDSNPTIKATPVFHVTGVSQPVYFDRWIAITTISPVTKEQRTALNDRYHFSHLRETGRTTVFMELSSNSPSPTTVVHELRHLPYIKTADPTFGYVSSGGCASLDTRPAPKVADQAYLVQMHVKAAWTYISSLGTSITRPTIRIALLDTGTDLHHPAFRGALLTGKDLLDPAGNGDIVQVDPPYHGTACAGILIARPLHDGNFTGIAAPIGAKLIPYRIADDDGSVTDVPILSALDAILNADISTRPQILSCSFDVPELVPLSAYTERLDRLAQANVLVVAAAGNRGNAQAVAFPASYGSVIAVGAVGKANTIWGYSQGEDESADNGKISVVGVSGSEDACTDAAAEGIWTTDIAGTRGRHAGNSPDADYFGLFWGTSASTPMVAGVAALVMFVRPDLSVKNVRSILETTAQKVPDAADYTNSGARRPLYGFGLICADEAVKLAMSRKPDGSFAITGEPSAESTLALADEGQGAPAIEDKSNGASESQKIKVSVGKRVVTINQSSQFSVIRTREKDRQHLQDVLQPGTKLPKKPVSAYDGTMYYIVQSSDIRRGLEVSALGGTSVEPAVDLSPLGGGEIGWFTGEILCSYRNSNARKSIVETTKRLGMRVESDSYGTIMLRPDDPTERMGDVVPRASIALAKLPGVDVFPQFPKVSKVLRD